jgi:DNA replication protein DnaC
MTDDMDFGRPPRHDRPDKRSDLRKMPASPVSLSKVRACAACGADVHVEIKGDVPEFLREYAVKMATGVLPAFCGECSERMAREEEERDEVEREQALLEERRRAAGLPAKWRAQTFLDLDNDTARVEARKLAEAWAAGRFPGLALHGPVGRGKTALAAAAANEMLRRRPLRWLPVAELLLDLRMPFDSQEYSRAVRRLDAMKGGSRAALVLDDLDKLKPTEHAVQPLYIAINAWVEAELPLLVTLNRDLDSLSEWMPDTFGDAIGSRLSGYCKIREVAGRDRRVMP